MIYSLYKQFDKYQFFIMSSDLIYSLDTLNLPAPIDDDIVRVGFSFGIIDRKNIYKKANWYYVTDLVTKILKYSPYEIIFVAGYTKEETYRLTINKKTIYIK